jgi:hypothetical protein
MKTGAKLITVFVSLLLYNNTQAQDDSQTQGRREKVESMKVAFITERLNLSVTEAQAFWPVYNEYQQKKKELHQQRGNGRKDFKADFDNMSDAEAEKLIDEDIARRQKELDLLKALHLKLKQILPAKKIALLYKTEFDFRKQMLEKLGNKPPR